MRACGCTLFWSEGLSLLWDTCGGPWPQKVRTPVLEHQGWEELQDSLGSTPAFTKGKLRLRWRHTLSEAILEAGLQVQGLDEPSRAVFLSASGGRSACVLGVATEQTPGPHSKGMDIVSLHTRVPEDRVCVCALTCYICSACGTDFWSQG